MSNKAYDHPYGATVVPPTAYQQPAVAVGVSQSPMPSIAGPQLKDPTGQPNAEQSSLTKIIEDFAAKLVDHLADQVAARVIDKLVAESHTGVGSIDEAIAKLEARRIAESGMDQDDRCPSLPDEPKAPSRDAAMQRVAAVLNDRSGYHVDDLDAGTRDDLLGAIVDAVALEELLGLREDLDRLSKST